MEMIAVNIKDDCENKLLVWMSMIVVNVIDCCECKWSL